MPEKSEKDQHKPRFTSSVLGAVKPTNILTEYFACFRGYKKSKAYILSWLDGEIYKKLLQDKPPWVYVVCHELADKFGCCRDTVQRHLKELCYLGILKRLPYKRWATDNIWQYTIDCDRLIQTLFSTFTRAIFNKSVPLGILWIRLFSFKEECLKKLGEPCVEREIAGGIIPPATLSFTGRCRGSRCDGSPNFFCAKCNAENQTAVSQKSDNRESKFQPPNVENQATYTNPDPIPSSDHTKTDDVEEKKTDEEEETEEEISGPTDEELGQALCEIRALSHEFQLNLNVKRAIYLNWAKVPAVVSYLKEAVRTWKVRPDFNWTGLLVKSLKSGVLDPRHREEDKPPKEYPRPTFEQLDALEKLGKLVYERINEPGYSEVLCVQVDGRGLFTWWEALGIEGVL